MGVISPGAARLRFVLYRAPPSSLKVGRWRCAAVRCSPPVRGRGPCHNHAVHRTGRRIPVYTGKEEFFRFPQGRRRSSSEEHLPGRAGRSNTKPSRHDGGNTDTRGVRIYTYHISAVLTATADPFHPGGGCFGFSRGASSIPSSPRYCPPCIRGRRREWGLCRAIEAGAERSRTWRGLDHGGPARWGRIMREQGLRTTTTAAAEQWRGDQIDECRNAT